MNSLSPILHSFQDDEFGQVRIVIINEDVWFVAMDIANALDYSDTHEMTKRLKESEIKKIKSGEIQGLSNQFGNNDLTIINESGFYRSVFGSRKENAEKFKDHVFGVILPQIRKTGAYLPEPKVDMLVDPKAFIKSMQDTIRALEAYQIEKAAKEKAIKERAYISDKKTATAMAKASALSKENTRLKIKLDESDTWYSIKRLENKLGYTFQNPSSMGKLLKQVGIDMGLPPRPVADVNYGTVLTHHKDVIEQVYPGLICW